MSKLLPEISKQMCSENIREVIEKNFVSIIPLWAPLQLAWVNNVYRTFSDYEKFMNPCQMREGGCEKGCLGELSQIPEKVLFDMFEGTVFGDYPHGN